jgi:hypothetical protein
MSEGKDVYVLNAEAKNFMLIMTDALEDKPTELINPIDTLPGRINILQITDRGK